MSSEKHEVTVYDRVPATASVSVAQLESYLRRTGWGPRRELMDGWSEWWSHDDEGYVDVPPGDDFREWNAQYCVERIADCGKRQPSAVLADIAREPLP